jgi:hypothetical protein
LEAALAIGAIAQSAHEPREMLPLMPVQLESEQRAKHERQQSTRTMHAVEDWVDEYAMIGQMSVSVQIESVESK